MNPVLIIGGGIAGLGVAWDLTRERIPVILLEAKSRWGGRIHTVASHGPVELGAEFVHGRDPGLLDLVSQAGGHVVPAPDEVQVSQKGERETVRLMEEVDKVLERIKPDPPDVSFADFLAAQNLPAHLQEWARGYVEGFNAADARRISAHSILRATYAAEQMDGSSQARLAQGYGPVIDFLVREIEAAGGKLVSGTAVRRADWKPGNVEVTTETDGRTSKLAGAAALFTLPLGVWKAGTVSLHPALPEKAEACRQLEFGNVMKVIFEFEQRWWDKPFGFLHAFDEPFPTWWAGSREGTLIAWSGGAQTQRIPSLGQEEVITGALETLGRLLPSPSRALRSRLLRAHFHNWAADPEIRGAYSYLPVNGLDLPKILAAAVKETLFFAGEATVFDAQMGTTFGALQSGLRAAREIREAVTRQGTGIPLISSTAGG